MLRIWAPTLFAATSMLLASSAHACRGAQLPQHGHLDGLEVLAVEVTGVHLTAYEFHKLIERGHAEPPASDDGADYLYPISSTPSFTVNVLIDSVVSGKSEPTREFTLGGCGAAVPKLLDKGIVFISADGSRVSAVWSSQGEVYLAWAQELGLSKPEHEP